MGAELAHQVLGKGTIVNVTLREGAHWPLFTVQFENKRSQFNERLFRTLQEDRLYLDWDVPTHAELLTLLRKEHPLDEDIKVISGRESPGIQINPPILAGKERTSFGPSQANVEPSGSFQPVSQPAFVVTGFDNPPEYIKSSAPREVCASLRHWGARLITRLRSLLPGEPRRVRAGTDSDRPKWMRETPVYPSRPVSKELRKNTDHSDTIPKQSSAPPHSVPLPRSRPDSSGGTKSRQPPVRRISTTSSHSKPVSGIASSSPPKPRSDDSRRIHYSGAADVRELHYITPIENVSSILQDGILSNRLAQRVDHISIAMQEVNARRRHRVVANGWTVHDHANLYFNARNPMMYVRRERHESLCVLCVSPDVFQEEWVTVTDGNAASDATRFFTDPAYGLSQLDFSFLNGDTWNAVPDGKRRKCAEVLVLHKVPAHLITGAYVSCETARQRLTVLAPQLQVTLHSGMFFVDVYRSQASAEWRPYEVPF